jgi:hypothetical protein
MDVAKVVSYYESIESNVLLWYNKRMNAINSREKTLIGRAEKVKFPTLDGLVLHARIDTGAKTSSMWAISTKVTKEGLKVEFPVEGSKKTITHIFPHYTRVKVASSMGHEQIRYKIRMSAVIKKRRIFATFTLADRSTQVYPVLVGRSTLTGKFIVDVAKGAPLRELEDQRSALLQANIEEEKV